MSESASTTPPGPIVACWTKLQIPTSTTIEDSKSEDGKKWFSASTHHNPTKTPGFEKVCFGRIAESPETVWYITAWKSKDALDKFERTEEYRSQRKEHEKFSDKPLETHRCDVGAWFWQHLTEDVGFIDAYFPADISNDSKEIANKARGLVYHFAPGGSSPSAYSHRPVRGWVHGTQDYEGQEAIALRLWHFWKNPEAEEKFKSSAGITVSPKSRYLTLYDYLMEQLSEAGLLGIREYHCNLVLIPNFWNDTSGFNPEDDDEDYS